MPATFLHLPGELRNSIYQRLLLVKGPIYPFSQRRRTIGTPKRFIEPTLLRANKQICQEATSMIYSGNEFDFTAARLDNRLVVNFLEQIGPVNVSFIRHVHADLLVVRGRDGDLVIEFDSIVALGKIEKACSNLQLITISRYGVTFSRRQTGDLPGLDMINLRYKRASSEYLTGAPMGLDRINGGKLGAKDVIILEFGRHGWKYVPFP